VDEVPAWKAETAAKNMSFGKATVKTLLEQRESLPIFALRTELLQSIAENQILVC
jgi:ATP-dependent RNA helicase DHX8/PRP22